MTASPDTAYLLDPTGSDHDGEAAALRARGPITRAETPGGIVVWVATDPALIRLLVNHPLVSKNPREHWPLFRDGHVAPTWPLASFVYSQNMFTTDAAEHRRLRSLVAPAFTATQVRAMRPRIEQVVHTTLDALATRHGSDPVDLREHFTHPVPLEIISTLLGIPAHARPDLRTAVEGIFATAATTQQRHTSQQTMQDTLRAVIDLKRRNPAQDVISSLITAHDDTTDSRLSDTELIDTLLLLIGAGHETTTTLLGNATVALLTHPDQRAHLLEGRVGWSQVIEETLRWHAPIANVPLYLVTADLDLGGGIRFRAGDAVMHNIAAANRDPGTYDDADRFDITRPRNDQHLAFGHGPHFCLGAPLARLEASVALPALFTRFPELALAVSPQDLRPQASLIAHGYQTLPVHLRI
ncbi:cytochrome P450 [Umezawaea sp. Da 62-37]|uniref:cytochrome P450 family protein n=1 Tax=Umezawaea sp. Da 62-37 TaxID=3075927 RepID=UPI0028F736EF|nr:cytochrome P450 [Umezawaea sp. Da 62-37]WNV85020.1 cytochrome P450 [Umezawaea sp. Da 62-37]